MEPVINLVFDFLSWLARTSWQASVLIILVMAIQIIFRRQLTPRWRYGLWLLVVARLLLPVLPESRLSIFNFERLASRPALMALNYIPARSYASSATRTASAETAARPAVSSAPAKPATDKKTRKFDVSGKTIFVLIWLGGVVVLFLRVLWDNHRFSSPVIRKRPVTDPALLNLLEDCKTEMRVHTPIQLIITPQVASPVLLGFIRPRLLLPENVTTSFSLQELHYIFLHEIAHVKRLDIPVNWLMTVLQILHWFNPFVWLAFGRMRIDREQACDALVLACRSLSYQPVLQGGVQDEKVRYGEIIIKLLTNITQTASLPSFVGILEGKSQMKTRIEMIAQFSRKSYQWSALAVILMAGLALVGFTRATDSTTPTVATNTPQNQGTSTPVNVSGKYSGVRAQFVMFRAKYQDGNWNANPYAMINLVIQLSQWSKGRIVQGLPKEVDIGSDTLFDVKPPFLYLTGDKDFKLQDNEIKNLRTYLQLGGAIWADNAFAGRQTPFDVAFRREIKRVLPDRDFEIVKPDHKMFNTFFAKVGLPAGINGSREPVEIINIDEQLAVLYTLNGYGTLWNYRLNRDGHIDRNAILKSMDENIQDDTARDAYKFGINCIVYLLTRYQEHFKFLPKASASPVKSEPAAVQSADSITKDNPASSTLKKK